MSTVTTGDPSHFALETNRTPPPGARSDFGVGESTRGTVEIPARTRIRDHSFQRVRDMRKEKERPYRRWRDE